MKKFKKITLNQKNQKNKKNYKTPLSKPKFKTLAWES